MSSLGKGHQAIAVASAVAAMLAMAALPAPSMAADLDQLFVASPPDSAPVQPVEFGTGWYIRGDVDAAFQTQASLSPSFNNEPSAHSTNWALEIGGGYKFNNWIRVDATYTYYGKQTSNTNGALVNCPASLNPVYSDPTDTVLRGVAPDGNQCTPKQSASLQKNLFLLNGYVDLGTWAGITPYVGAGAGAAYITANQSANFYNVSDGSPYAATLTLPNNLPLPITYYNPATGLALNPQPHYNTGPQNWNYSYSTSKWNFAFALMAGVSYDLTSNAKLDIGYRYVNFGSFSGITSLSGALFSNQTTTQEVRVGIRYQID
jgi:opacity protein-like surface antigen